LTYWSSPYPGCRRTSNTPVNQGAFDEIRVTHGGDRD
jgi:hypothetical protein